MAKDYKHRAQSKKTPYRGRGSGRTKLAGLLTPGILTAALIGVATLVYYLKNPHQKTLEMPPAATEAGTNKPNKPNYPHYDFYHSLSKKEIVISEHEAKTRSREELVGAAQGGQYMLQAGSFTATKDAEALIKKLATMGLPAKIDKITVTANKKLENVKLEPKTWYRVKIGPYSQMSTVDAICSRLKKNGIEVMITESEH